MLATLLLTCAQEVPQAATEWIRKNAIPFQTVEAGNGFQDLQPLKPLIGDARIVALGEPTHGTREAFQMKHRLLEFLVTELGFSIFSIEASMPEAYELNRYVIEGEGDPKALIGGMYFWTWNTEEVLAMVEWMRAYNAAGPRTTLQFTGFDMQTPDVAADIVRDAVRAHLRDLYRQVDDNYELVEDLRRRGSGASAFGVATGTFPVAAARGRSVRFSGWIRTEDLRDGFAGLWWRVDGPTGVLAFDNMEGRGPKGTSDWARYEIVLDVPPEATNINFGVIMPGAGASWFDDLEVALDGQPYADWSTFNGGFESEALALLSPSSGNYAARRVTAQPHGGGACLEIRGAPPQGPEPDHVVAAAQRVLAELQAQRDALVARTSPKDADWILQNARVVVQCARLFAGGQSGFNVRDECMADNVEWILGQNPGARIVLWAHNGHVSRGTLWGATWMGQHLEQKFPGQMAVFGFSTSAGRYTAMSGGRLASDNDLLAPPDGSVEAYLRSAAVPRLFLDVRGAQPGDPGSGWLTESRPMRSIGALAMDEQFYAVVPKDMFDVLVHIETTTSARQLDTPPGR
ncbi:MAG: erythromycin esterase family protein [Planctomycetota bacterium]|nr:MAG: erythromycin esterase family protein [Planctomycetota bacterium]